MTTKRTNGYDEFNVTIKIWVVGDRYNIQTEKRRADSNNTLYFSVGGRDYSFGELYKKARDAIKRCKESKITVKLENINPTDQNRLRKSFGELEKDFVWA